MARPTIQTPEIIDLICNRLSEGKPLAQICRSKGMPGLRTVYDWMEAQPDISACIARARDVGEEVISADCLRIADRPKKGVETVTKSDGSSETRCGDMLGHRKLQIDTRLKLLAKWNPKKWGERITQELTGKDGGAIQYEDIRERNLQTIEQLSARLSGPAAGEAASPAASGTDPEPDPGTKP
jgi:hypothetical protein